MASEDEYEKRVRDIPQQGLPQAVAWRSGR